MRGNLQRSRYAAAADACRSRFINHTAKRYAVELADFPSADWAAANRPRALRNLRIFDGVLSDRPFIAGDRFTVADITGLVALDFTRPARIAIPAEFVHLNRWRNELTARPSATA